MRSRADVQYEEIADVIDEFNETMMLPRGLYMRNPMEHGMRVVRCFNFRESKRWIEVIDWKNAFSQLEVTFLYVAREKREQQPAPAGSNLIVPRV